ncbi:MAG: hypothetical protein L0271_08895 [Gemmatimonadetes bacterium]|nr:hypothetical protein [Gemmatimonadota bacterium]
MTETTPWTPGGGRLASSRSSRAAGVLLALVTFAGGCNCNGPNAIDSVVIVPPVVFAEDNAPFLVEAWALDDRGRRRPFPGAVPWTVPAGITAANSNVNPALLTGRLPAGLDAVTLSGITATINGRTSPAAQAIISQTGATMDQLILSATADALPAAVLIDAATSGAGCAVDITVVLVGRAALPDNLTDACASEMALFSAGHGAHLDRSAVLAATSPWTTGVDEVTISTLDPLLPVPLAYYWATGSTVDLGTLKAQVGNANQILQTSRVGVSFDPPSLAQVQVGPELTILQANCGSAETLLATVLDLDVAFLYIIYAKDIIVGGKGFTCVPAATRPAGFIVMSVNTMIDKTLAHELGHMMGLLEPFNGHTNDKAIPIEGFDWSNFMWAWDVAHASVYRIRASLGQAYRMNFHDASWIVQSIRPNPSVPCQCDPYADSPCPKLSADVFPTPKPSGPAIC